MDTNWFEMGKDVREQGCSEREAGAILRLHDEAKQTDPATYGPPFTDADIDAFWDGFYRGTKIQCGG